MRIKLLVGVLCLSLLSIGFGESHQRMLDRVTGSIVRITGQKTEPTPFGVLTGGYVCSGFVVAVERVVTAAHCLGDQMTADGLAVRVLKADTYYDLALIEVKTAKPALDVRTNPIARGDTVTAIGYGQGLTAVTPIEASVMLVDYQLPADMGEYPPFVFVQGEYIGGMSGGPVVDGNGQVIGVVQMSGDGVGVGVGTLLVRAFLLGAL